MDNFEGTMFLFLLIFWGSLIGLSNYWETSVLLGDISSLTPQERIDRYNQQGILKNIIDGLFDFLDEIPVINIVVPLLKIMSFQYVDDIPYYLTIVLNIFAIITGVISLKVIRN